MALGIMHALNSVQGATMHALLNPAVVAAFFAVVALGVRVADRYI